MALGWTATPSGINAYTSLAGAVESAPTDGQAAALNAAEQQFGA